ncbi:MAG: DUF805 domain-containing protein [Alphaproteobacteria bacterium]
MSQPSLAKTFMNAMFGLEGRIRRSDFWVSSIALFIAAALLSVAVTALIRFYFHDVSRLWLLLVILMIQLLVAWPSYAITVKRGHDRDFSAVRTLWVNVIAHVVPIGLIVVPLLLDKTPQWQGAFWVFAVLTVYMIFDYGVLDGTKGENKYGPSPKGAIQV